MYRNTKRKAVKRIGLSAVLAAGVLGTGIGVASASTHSHSRHAHESGVNTSTTDHGRKNGRDEGKGHAFALRGFITAVTSTSITISGRNGTSASFALDSSTTIMKGHSAATVADLKVGERVFIVPSSTSSSTAASVFIAGTEDRNGQDQRGQSRADDDNSLEGVVSAASLTSITITEKGGASATFALDSSTTVTMGHSAGTLASLAVGEMVQVTPSSTSPTTAASVEIDLAHVAGTVTGVNGDTITVTTEGGASVSVLASSSTTFTMNGSNAPLTSVTPGSFIFAEGTMASASTLDATSIAVGAPTGAGDSVDVSGSVSLGVSLSGD
jgi:Domain of unknown function (DUF5666)